MESFTLKQLAILARASLADTPALERLTEEMFEEMYKHISTALGLIIVNRHSNQEPELNLFISSGVGFNFSDFRPNFLRTCLMTTRVDPRQAMEMIQATENTINLLLQKFNKVEIEKLGQFEIQMLPVWRLTASDEISMPPKSS